MSDVEDRNNVPSPPRQEGFAIGLTRAVGRGMARAVRARTVFGLREHVVTQQARKQIIAPIADAIAVSKAAYRAAKDAAKDAPTGELFVGIDAKVVDRWIRNAEWTWVLAAALSLVAAGFISFGTTRSGFTGFHTVTGGSVCMIYAASLMLRSARDAWVMRNRAPLSLRDFFNHLDKHWMPLGPKHPFTAVALVAYVPSLIITMLIGPLMMVSDL